MKFKVKVLRKQTCEDEKILYIEAEDKEAAQEIFDSHSPDELFEKYGGVSVSANKITDSGWKAKTKITVVKG